MENSRAFLPREELCIYLVSPFASLQQRIITYLRVLERKGVSEVYLV